MLRLCMVLCSRCGDVFTIQLASLSFCASVLADLRTLAQDESESQLVEEFERVPTFMAAPEEMPDGVHPKNRCTCPTHFVL